MNNATLLHTMPAIMDAHLHLRDGDIMRFVAPHSAAQCEYAIIMPNTKPPITSGNAALHYKHAINEAAPNIIPLMTLYASPTIALDRLAQSYEQGEFFAIKYYPKNATTNAEAGVKSMVEISDLLSLMQECKIPLLMHGEIADKQTDIFDREHLFLEHVLKPLMDDYPDLSITLEHITTKQAIDFVIKGGDNIYASITPHHLHINRNAIFNGGINPHHYCLPIAKREEHRQALCDIAVSGNPKFFAGSDSAPHTKNAKENACGCAGIYNALYLIEYYYMVFQQAGSMQYFDDFMVHYACQRYGLPTPQGRIEIHNIKQQVPNLLTHDNYEIVPFMAGQELPVTARRVA